MSLPSIAEAESILSKFTEVSEESEYRSTEIDIGKIELEEKWRLICLSGLSYGVEYNCMNDISNIELQARGVKTVDFFTKLVVKYDKNEIINVLIDAFWLVGNLLEQPKKKENLDDSFRLDALRNIICGLATKLPSSFTKQLQITLDPVELSKCRLVPGKMPFSTKIKRHITNMIYRQKKFNLFIEESEGYSKLLTFLFSSYHLIVEDKKGTVNMYIRELMGSFDLDPNRVLDILLNVLEIYLDKKGENNVQVISILRSVMIEFKRESLPQLLGFKISATAEQPGDSRKSLYVTCAYLICHDLIELEYLVPYMVPAAKRLRETYEENWTLERKRIKKIGVISLNASAKNDKTISNENLTESNDKETENKQGTSENLVVSMFESLLFFEAWEKTCHLSHLISVCCDDSDSNSTTLSMELLSKACVISPKISDAICKLIHKIIEPVYELNVRSTCLFFKEVKVYHEKKNTEASLIPNSVKVKRIDHIEELISNLYMPLTAIAEVGGIKTDPVLYCKLCRLFKSYLTKTKVKEMEYKELDKTLLYLLKSFLVPSLSLFPSNPSISTELWNCLNSLPYTTRYALYDAWRTPHLEKNALRAASSVSSKTLTLIESEINTGIDCRYTLKRLTAENYKDLGKQLAKTCHNNPIVVFTSVLNQIETYDNLIPVMVDSFRFVTRLSLDVLGYCLLLSLGGREKFSGSRISSSNVNGMGTIQWLTSLSQFAGALYKKFPEIEVRAIIFHIINELRHGRTTVIPLMRSLLTHAGGYDFADCDDIASLSPVQLEGRSGSRLLKRETSSFGILERPNKKSVKKIREVLQDKKVGLPLLLLLAQVKEKVMYKSIEGEKEHLKIIGKEFDSCHSLLGLLSEFLTDTTDEDIIDKKDSEYNLMDRSTYSKYAKMIPTLVELRKDYGLNLATSWLLCRPLVHAAFSSQQKFLKSQKAEEEGEEIIKSTPPKFLSPYLPSSNYIISSYKCLIPESLQMYITLPLYECFWTFSLYDVHCPEERYKTEIIRLKKDQGRLTAKLSELRSKDTLSNVTLTKVDLERIVKSTDNLSSDLKEQKNHCQFFVLNLEDKKPKFFPEVKEKIAENSTLHFLSTCIFPRCLVSPEDAIYCAKFIEKLHNLETPGFQTLHYLDHLISAIAATLFCVTEDEAGNVGILLLETWTMLSRWRYNETKYNDEVFSKYGSTFDEKKVTYSDYSKFYNKWHLTVGTSVVGCLQSKEYIHIRAAIVVLSRVVDVYPTRSRLGDKLFKNLLPLQEDNSRPDIKTMANAYHSLLDKAMREGVWKEQDAAKAKKIIEEEKLKAKEKAKEAKKLFDDMKKDQESIERGQRPRGPHRFGVVDRGFVGSRRHDQALSPAAAVFTPANGAPTRDLYSHSHNRDNRDNYRSDNAAPNTRGPSYRTRDRDRDRDRERDRSNFSRERGNVGASNLSTNNGGSSISSNGHGHIYSDTHRSDRSKWVGPHDGGGDRVNTESNLKRDRPDSHRDDLRSGDRDYQKRQRHNVSSDRGNAPPPTVTRGSGVGGGRSHGHNRRTY